MEPMREQNQSPPVRLAASKGAGRGSTIFPASASGASLLYRTSYQQDLLQPPWYPKRGKIKERDNWTCQRCGNCTGILHVHHMAYIEGRKPWEYPDEFLVTLCTDCHPTIHGFDLLSEDEVWFIREARGAHVRCVACDKHLEPEEVGGRNGKHEPICELCCLELENDKWSRS
jgi:hypothetical protein